MALGPPYIPQHVIVMQKLDLGNEKMGHFANRFTLWRNSYIFHPQSSEIDTSGPVMFH